MEAVVATIGSAVGRFSLHVEGCPKWTEEKSVIHSDDTSDDGGLRSMSSDFQ